jgi:hypothetical protein
MEVTMTELALFAWAMVATLFWQQTKHDLKVHRSITGELLKRIAKGKIKVIESEDSFEFKEV